LVVLVLFFFQFKVSIGLQHQILRWEGSLGVRCDDVWIIRPVPTSILGTGHSFEEAQQGSDRHYSEKDHEEP
jgi:hypothetical protein